MHNPPLCFFLLLLLCHQIKITCSWILSLSKYENNWPFESLECIGGVGKDSTLVQLSSSIPAQHDVETSGPELILLIPAYNEENRIESTLEAYQDFLINLTMDCGQARIIQNPQIVVVDDGSNDQTTKVVQKFHNKIPIHCITMEQNGGKGAALVRGVQYINEMQDDATISQASSSSIFDAQFASNTLILTQDADGSGDLIYLTTMTKKLANLLPRAEQEIVADSNPPTVKFSPEFVDWSALGMVVGNRNYNFFTPRGVLRWGFQTVVRLLMNDLRVQDSQCGYKLMTLPTAKLLYKDLHLRGWSHDVEILYRAKLLDIPIDEICIDWQDKDGSKVVASGVAKVSLQMLWDVIRLRWNYSIRKCWE